VIQAETLEEAQAIVNSSPHARDGMLADSGAGRGVASAYWAWAFLRLGLCSRPHTASDGYGKAAITRGSTSLRVCYTSPVPCF